MGLRRGTVATSLGDLHAQFTDAGDAADQRVAGDDCRHTFGGARVDQVTGLQLPRGRQVFDGFTDVPDQLGDVAALAVLAVHLDPDLGVLHVTGLRGFDDRADGRRLVERLAYAPGT